jgi:ElaB/YqjD/DUF883 family membrane-anchored ribosome-binding protein
METSGQSGGGSAVGDKVEQTKDVVAAQTNEVTERGRGMVRDQLDQRSTQLGEQAGSASQTLRQVAEQARLQGNSQQAHMAELAADRSERLGSFLREADGERMLSEAEDFARREPWVVAGAGLAIGFLLARSLKASSAGRYQRRSGVQPTYRTAYSAQSAYEHTARPPYPQPSSVGVAGNGDAETTSMDLGATP